MENNNDNIIKSDNVKTERNKSKEDKFKDYQNKLLLSINEIYKIDLSIDNKNVGYIISYDNIKNSLVEVKKYLSDLKLFYPHSIWKYLKEDNTTEKDLLLFIKAYYKYHSYDVVKLKDKNTKEISFVIKNK